MTKREQWLHDWCVKCLSTLRRWFEKRYPQEDFWSLVRAFRDHYEVWAVPAMSVSGYYWGREQVIIVVARHEEMFGSVLPHELAHYVTDVMEKHVLHNREWREIAAAMGATKDAFVGVFS